VISHYCDQWRHLGQDSLTPQAAMSYNGADGLNREDAMLKYWPLIAANLRRRPARTALPFVAALLAFTLYGLGGSASGSRAAQRRALPAWCPREAPIHCRQLSTFVI
jgi:hypothetical protein